MGRSLMELTFVRDVWQIFESHVRHAFVVAQKCHCILTAKQVSFYSREGKWERRGFSLLMHGINAYLLSYIAPACMHTCPQTRKYQGPAREGDGLSFSHIHNGFTKVMQLCRSATSAQYLRVRIDNT